MTSPGSRVLLVCGAVSYDYLVYPMGLERNSSPSTQSEPYDCLSQLVIRTGAADLVAQLLTAAAPLWNFEVLAPAQQPLVPHGLKNNASSVVDLAPTKSNFHESKSFRPVRRRQIDKPPVWHSPPTDQACLAKGSTVIISGSGEAFRDVEPALDFLERVRPKYVVHHMTLPLAAGPLWDIIRDGPRTREGIPEPDHLAIIVDADDLRAEGISLRRSLSWEATAQDFVTNLGSNGKLDTLTTCPNLIVRFGNEGVIHHRGRDATGPTLYFNPQYTEKDYRLSGGNESQMVELASAFTAGFSLGFASSSPPNCEKGIRLGISAARQMDQAGFVTNPLDEAPDYPVNVVADSLAPEKAFSVVSIPSGKISSGENWSIFNDVTGDVAEVSRHIITAGPEKALSRCPTQKFGESLSVERSEQESLRAVVQAVEQRLISESSEPTSIGLIGPPGSGKKFLASNLVKHFATNVDVRELTYNARLLRREDLTALCNTIRDHTVSGELTAITFENFEAILDPKSELLNDFLAIMRDGMFSDRGQMRSLGHPLLFFLVNQDAKPLAHMTNSTNLDSIDTLGDDESVLLDHLHGVIRVAGPNQADSDDKMYPVRRAMMLRHMLKKKFPHLERNGQIRVEEAVLHALLFVPAYKHGLRSLDKILSTSRLSGRTKFDVAALPPEEQIQLHVDGRTFMSYLRSPKLPASLREKLAQGLFEAYKKKRHEIARSDAEKKALDSDRSLADWDDLAQELKESTRAQADDIPRKLRAVECFMLASDRKDPLVHVPEFSEEQLDMLSEMEHERFNAERLQRQWRIGSRNSKQRTTPFLVPWRDLSQDWKDVDRVMVECVPRVLAANGWKIYKMQDDSQ